MSVSDTDPSTESSLDARGPDPGVITGPPVYQRHPFVVIGAFAVGMVLVALNVHGHYGQGLLVNWILLSISGVGFYLVFGLGGQFAFSQAAFYGIGAYTSAWATKGKLDPLSHEVVGGHNYLVGLAAAIVVSGIVALVFAVAVRKTNHFYFAIATLALSFMAITVFQNWTSFSNGGEVSNIPAVDLFGFTFDTDLRQFGLLLGALVVVLALIALIERSPMGRELVALRDNEAVAATLGVPTKKLRYLAFVIGSTLAAVAGSLYANTAGALTIDSFGISLGIDIFLVVLLGGIGSMWGAVIGAAFVVWVPTKLGFVGSHTDLVYGALLIIVVIFAPKGLVGIVQSAWAKLRSGRRNRAAPDSPASSVSMAGGDGV